VRRTDEPAAWRQHRPSCPGCWRWCRTCWPAGGPAWRRWRGLRHHRGPLRKDLNLLWVCGLPGHGPGDLIDVEFEGETVTLLEPAGVTRPLRLTVDEALALIVALRALAETPGPGPAGRRGPGAGQGRAGGRRRRRAGAAGRDRGRGRAAGPAGGPHGARAVRRLHLSYYVPGRDETTERDVDPMRLLLVEGRSYLEAWCRRAEGVRLFRLDRVHEVALLDLPPSRPPTSSPATWPGAVPAGTGRPAHHAGPAARAAWVADYHPCESVTEDADGGLLVRLRPATPPGCAGWPCGSGPPDGWSPGVGGPGRARRRGRRAGRLPERLSSRGHWAEAAPRCQDQGPASPGRATWPSDRHEGFSTSRHLPKRRGSPSSDGTDEGDPP
jgi:proteasome accessory factor C